MDIFINQLKDNTLKSQLENITDKEELYREFRNIMERTGQLGSWNKFRRKEIEDYVKNILVNNLGNEVATDDDVYSQ